MRPTREAALAPVLPGWRLHLGKAVSSRSRASAGKGGIDITERLGCLAGPKTD